MTKNGNWRLRASLEEGERIYARVSRGRGLVRLRKVNGTSQRSPESRRVFLRLTDLLRYAPRRAAKAAARIEVMKRAPEHGLTVGNRARIRDQRRMAAGHIETCPRR